MAQAVVEQHRNGRALNGRRPQRRSRPHVAGRPRSRRVAPAEQVPAPDPVPSPSPAPPHKARFRRELPWWFSELVIPTVVALLTGALVAWGTIKGQAMLDDAREDRALRLENLRFVRDHSTADPDQPRPFGGLDLSGQHLRGLQLAHANFDDANLEGAVLNDSNLHRASFQYARLTNADLTAADLMETNMEGTDLSNATLGRTNLQGAILNQTSLYGTNLKTANLNGATLTCVYYDASTSWPPGFVPPPVRDNGCPAAGARHR